MARGDCKLREPKDFIGFKAPVALIEKIEEFKVKHKKSTLTDAILELLQVGLMVDAKISSTGTLDSNAIKELEEQLDSSTLVDYLERMEPNRFNLILKLMKDEGIIRERKVSGRQKKLTF